MMEFLCRRGGTQRRVSVVKVAHTPEPGKPAVGCRGREKTARRGCGPKGERVTTREVPTCAGLRGVTPRPSRGACAGPAGLAPSWACGEAHPEARCHGGARRACHLTQRHSRQPRAPKTLALAVFQLRGALSSTLPSSGHSPASRVMPLMSNVRCLLSHG
jgi:hypothetical protein